MPLQDRPDFQRWLTRIETAHRDLHEAEPSPEGKLHCDCCGVELNDRGSSCRVCLVCLAEQYGRDQADEAGRIGRVLAVALSRDLGTPLDVIRATIEDVLVEHEFRDVVGV